MVRNDAVQRPLTSLLSGKVSAVQLMFTSCSSVCPIQGALFQAAPDFGSRFKTELAMFERGDAGLTPTQQRAVEGARRAQQVAVEILDDVSRLAAALGEATPARLTGVPVPTLLADMQAAARVREATIALPGLAPGVDVHCDPASTPAALAAVAVAIAREHGAPLACAVDAAAGLVALRLTVEDAPATAARSEAFNELRAGMGLRLVVAVDHLRRIGGHVAEIVSGNRSFGVVVELPRAGTVAPSPR